jgi:uncharacterized protein YcbK (DUF882 family)
MNTAFLNKLELARKMAGIPFIITSGYRSQVYNDSLAESVPNSAHTKGLACDIALRSDEDRRKIVHALVAVGFSRFGLGNSYVHVDDDTSKPTPAVWTYKSTPQFVKDFANDVLISIKKKRN